MLFLLYGLCVAYTLDLSLSCHSGKIFLGRSAVRDVAEKRLPELNNYLKVCVYVCVYVFVRVCMCVWCVRMRNAQSTQLS